MLNPDPAAIARSMELLAEHLTPVQYGQLKVLGQFAVDGSAGGRYVIANRVGSFSGVAIHTYNVIVVRVGQFDFLRARPAPRLRPLDQLCVIPRGTYPLGDVLLAQKLCLELDERLFVALAYPRLRERLGIMDHPQIELQLK